MMFCGNLGFFTNFRNFGGPDSYPKFEILLKISSKNITKKRTKTEFGDDFCTLFGDDF